MQAPCGCAVTAVGMVGIVHCVACGGNNLFAGRSDCPSAAINAAGFDQRLNLNGGTVDFLAGFQLLLIRIDFIRKIQRPAHGLCRCVPRCVELGLHIRFLAAVRGGPHDSNRLPATNRRLIDVSVVVGVGCIGGGTTCQPVNGILICLPGHTVGVMLHNPLLGRIVASGRVFALVTRRKGRGIRAKQAKRKLTQPAPNIDLVGIVVARRILRRLNDGGVTVGISRTSSRLSAQPVVATIRRFAIKPNQPGAVHLLCLGDFAARDCRRRPLGVGCAASAVQRGGCGFRAIHMDSHALFQHSSIRRFVHKLRSKALTGLEQNAGCRGRGFVVACGQNCCGLIRIGSLAATVRTQHFHAIRQDDVGAAAVSRVFHLHHDRHNGKILTILQGQIVICL